MSPEKPFRIEFPVARWASSLAPSALQEMLLLLRRPDLISFALGLPAPEFFPTKELAQAAESVWSSGPAALQYTPCLQTLKTRIVELMKYRGVSCREEQIFITTGAQQGISLLARLFLEQRGPVVLEEMIYSGFQQVLDPLQPEKLSVPTDQDSGMDVEAVASHLRKGIRPAFIYTITEGHNPCGVSLHPDKRVRLVELARQYQVPIIEDDAYGFLCYEKAPLPPLRALDERWVCYAGTFSKILAPALRVGWVVVSEELIGPLSVVKEAADINTATFTQRVVQAYLETGQLPEHLNRLRREYGTRRDAMLSALREYFPAAARWNKPDSGFFVWVKLPGELDANELLKIAIETEQVAFIPGDAFRVSENGSKRQYLRLNFSHCAPDQITKGIQRLARVLHRIAVEESLLRV